MKLLRISHALIDEARDHGFTLKPYTEKENGSIRYCVEVRPSPLDMHTVLIVKRDDLDAVLLSAFQLAVGEKKTRRVRPCLADCSFCKGKGGKTTMDGTKLIYARCGYCLGSKKVDSYELTQ